jgi:hypothetical protein
MCTLARRKYCSKGKGLGDEPNPLRVTPHERVRLRVTMLDSSSSASAQVPKNHFDELSPRDQRRIARLIVGQAHARGIATLDFALLHHLRNLESVRASFAREDVETAEKWCLNFLRSGFFVAIAYKRGRGWEGPTPCVRDGRYWRPYEYFLPYASSLATA